MASAKCLKIKKFSEIPGPPRIPILGNLYLYKFGMYKVEEYQNVLLKMYRKYGPLVREDLGPKNKIIHVFDLKDAKTVFSNEGPMPFIEPLQETTKLYRKIKNTSPGLGNTNGEEWYKLRSAVRKLILKPKEVQRYLPQLNQISDELVTRLKNISRDETNEIGNLRLEIAKWSREVSGWICFGRRLGCFDNGKQEEEATNIIELNKMGFRLSSKLKFSLPIYKIIQTPKWKELTEIEEKMHRSVINLVETTMKNNKDELSGYEESFLAHLRSQEELSSKDVEMLVLSVFGDGLSTTVPALIYNLYCLAVNPQIQEEVRNEVRSATRGGYYVSADIINNKLQLLKAFVKETFRMYPIGTEISRIIKSDLILSNYHIPKGTHVHLNQVIQLKSNKYFKEPEKFQPVRWLRDGHEEIDPILSVPFGHGTRACAGRRLAEQDIYVSLSKILLNFELQYPKSLPPLKQIYEVLLFPKEPIRIKFKPFD